jgi:ribosomal protein S18 acetylase RimI-like enzyme
VEYRLYRAEDFGALYAIEEVCFQPPHRFGKGYMRMLLKQADGAAWIAERDEAMCGFGIVEWGMAADEGVMAYVQTLEVLPEARGAGAGSELLRRLEGSARDAGAVVIWLHVDAENGGAIRLYERGGYHPAGQEPDHYGRGRAGLVYAKQLD